MFNYAILDPLPLYTDNCVFCSWNFVQLLYQCFTETVGDFIGCQYFFSLGYKKILEKESVSSIQSDNQFPGILKYFPIRESLFTLQKSCLEQRRL